MRRTFCFEKIICIVLLTLCCFSLFSETPQDLYAQGKLYQDQEEWYLAIESYREAVNKNSAYGEAWKGLAQCAYGLDEYTLCMSYLKNARKYLFGDPELDTLEAFSYIGLGNLDQARSLFESVLIRFPNDKQSRFGLAELDIASGKNATASSLYLDALKRQPENKKALLSLAVLFGESGDWETAKKYANLALLYHGGNAQVYYYAAWISAREGNYEEAEGRVRGALRLKPDYDKATELLASILYAQKRYSEVVEVCDQRISVNRNSGSAWYLKALAQEGLNKQSEALQTYIIGMSVSPDDQFLRAACESLVLNFLPVENTQRNDFAKYHSEKAKKLAENHYSDQAIFEYRRALKLDPYDADIRFAYAKLLLKKRFFERYVEQLNFIIAQGKPSQAVKDSYESYFSLTRNSLAKKWDVNVTILDKSHLSLGLYFEDSASNVFHPQAERITTELLAEVLSQDGRYTVSSFSKPISNFSQAFRQARSLNQQYFGLVSLEEASDRIKLKVSIYVSRTGLLAKEIVVYRSGADNFYSSIRKMASSIISVFPKRSVILKRNGNTALIDAGFADEITKDQVFTIFKPDTVSVADEGIGVRYQEDNIIGTCKILSLGEDVSEVYLSRIGFYDRIAAGDILVELAENSEKSDNNQLIETTDIAAPRLLEMLHNIRD